MNNRIKNSLVLVFLISAIIGIANKSNAQSSQLSYNELKKSFASPDYSYWGEVPLWWWEADSLDKERVTWQLEALSAKGVKAVCPIQRSPARSYPESFSKEWWEMLSFYQMLLIS